MADNTGVSTPLITIGDDEGGYAWLTDIACGHLETLDPFFVKPGHTIDPATLTMCQFCPVRVECTIAAYNGNTAGYRAGLSPSTRAKLTVEEAVDFVKKDTAEQYAELSKWLKAVDAAEEDRAAAEVAEAAQRAAADVAGVLVD